MISDIINIIMFVAKFGFIILGIIGLAIALFQQFILKKPNKSLPLWHPATMVGTFFYVGKIPLISGTFGSAAAVSLIISLVLLPQDIALYGQEDILSVMAGGTIFFFLAGLWASNIYAERTDNKDPGEIVMDEVAGQFLTVTFIGMGYYMLLLWDEPTFLNMLVFSPQYLIISFLLFRLFDIWKPGVIGRVDRDLSGGLGVMLDDMLAGAFAAATFFAIFFTTFYSGFLYWALAHFFPDLAMFVEK